MIRHGLTNATSGGRLLLLAARSAAGSSAPTGGTTAAAAASVANWCSSVSAAETFACTTVSFGGGTHLRTGVRSLLQQQLEPLLAFTSRREFSMTALRMYADDTANNFGASRREGSGDGAKPTQRQQPQPQPQPSAPQAAAAAAKQLRAEIKETGSDIKRLLGVIDSRGDCFDDAAVMCAFRQLCEACGPLSRDELEKQVGTAMHGYMLPTL